MTTRRLLLAAPLALTALAGVTFSLAARPPQAPPPAADTKVVPFTMLPSNHMVVEAKLNGKGPFRFIFDLGAPGTLVSNRAADASGAMDKKALKWSLMGTRGEGKVKKVEMGDHLVADDLTVIVMDPPAAK